MDKYIIAFPSVTHAHKAGYEFTRRGIKAEVTRTPAGLAKGCGYSVKASAKLETLKEILEETGIHYRAVGKAE